MIENFITNKIKFESKKKYCCIIGLNPSMGARSPKLWKACFERFKIKANFYALDVEKKNLNNLINFLKKDSNFIGGAVAVPYKEDIINLLDHVENEAKNIGAVNIIYKRKNKLIGSNSDGLGALQSIENTVNLSISSSVL